jgi:SAM-dependent methyltransferase
MCWTSAVTGGGFLRLLHALKPFRSGVGIDIAEASVRAARAMAGPAPVTFEVATNLAPWQGRFDLAFCYEVIYLLPDLASHAAAIHAALRPGGVYDAVTGCHTDGPLWPALRELIDSTTNAPVQDRSPDEYAASFAAAGFDVSVRRFGFNGFVPAFKDRRYFPRMTDAVDYYARDKLLFRMVRQDVPAP